MEVRFLDAGDCAVTVEFGDTIERALSERVLRLGARVREQLPPGVIEAVPTFRSLMVHYDPLATDRASVVAQLETLLDDGAAAQASATLWRIPACYEGDCAPDLDDVAARTGLAPRDVVRLHADTLFHVYMIGFVPGYPYMGDLPAQLVLPRRADPRVRVPPGSIAIASTMTAIYPLESPGGWHLIGTTPVRLFDAASASPSLLRPGDKVRFEPVPAAQFAEIGAAVAAGAYVVPHEAFTS
ncbi:5-oxoprolinase subunit PxpB [Burkholderia anthina]|uniref:5-oxoprolinase subunit PxpB n=1 Tax=Burkholderia anthina TaxID=179879 RepID=UPI00158B8B31|nr:5-oxoprolinase subunit PxpB [Burkholderia anthina]